MFLFVTCPQAFTENIFLIFYIWCFFEQFLEHLPHIILSHYISVPALCPFKAHLIASWAGQLAGPSVNLGVPIQKLQELHCFPAALPQQQCLAVPVCQIWRKLDLPSLHCWPWSCHSLIQAFLCHLHTMNDVLTTMVIILLINFS